MIDTLARTKWRQRWGNHTEERIGLVNFSTVGRNCTQEVREDYYEWDKTSKERNAICKRIMKELPKLEATVGGHIS